MKPKSPSDFSLSKAQVAPWHVQSPTGLLGRRPQKWTGACQWPRAPKPPGGPALKKNGNLGDICCGFQSVKKSKGYFFRVQKIICFAGGFKNNIKELGFNPRLICHRNCRVLNGRVCKTYMIWYMIYYNIQLYNVFSLKNLPGMKKTWEDIVRAQKLWEAPPATVWRPPTARPIIRAKAGDLASGRVWFATSQKAWHGLVM